MNKRGLSQVVTTVILILVILAAIVILWAAIRPTIQKASEQVTADCITIDLEVVSCSAGGTAGVPVGQTGITVKRSSGGGDLTAIRFVFDGGDAVSVDSTLGKLETQEHFVTSKDYAGEMVNVAAVVGQENVCPESSSAPVQC